MSGLELYTIIDSFASEYHSDTGFFFIDPYNYEEFAEAINPYIGYESVITATITTGGSLCIDIEEFRYKTDELDEVKEKLVKKYELH